MKHAIIHNEKRKTLTVVLSPVSFNYTKYLYEKYQDQKFFANGILESQDYTNEVLPFVKDLVQHLNALSVGILPNGESFSVSDIITLNENEYRLLTKNIDKDGNWDKRFRVNLSSKSKQENKHFLFTSLDESQAISEEDSRKYTYGIELEIGIGYNEDNLEKYLYTVFHRAIAVAKKKQSDDSFKSNDSAWNGFNFGSDDDLPF
jgi:hypothetical protein